MSWDYCFMFVTNNLYIGDRRPMSYVMSGQSQTGKSSVRISCSAALSTKSCWVIPSLRVMDLKVTH